MENYSQNHQFSPLETTNMSIFTIRVAPGSLPRPYMAKKIKDGSGYRAAIWSHKKVLKDCMIGHVFKLVKYADGTVTKYATKQEAEDFAKRLVFDFEMTGVDLP